MAYDPNSPLPPDQVGTLEAMLLVLEQIANNMPTINLGTKAQRVNVETMPTTSAVTLPSTIVAGLTASPQVIQDWNRAAADLQYSRIIVS